MSTASDLVTLGWRDGSRQSIFNFQAAYNFHGGLEADGVAGPATLAAIAYSLARKAQGLPDISRSFSAWEFACNCGKRKGGPYDGCQRIWTPRATIELCERYRLLVGPFSPERAGRCPQENRNVGGVPNSYHLTGKAVDVPVFRTTIAQAHAIGANGVGYYVYGADKYVRHIDIRSSRVVPWPYPQSSRPAVALTPRPDLAITPTTSEEDDDMPLNDADKKYLAELVKNQVKAVFVEMSTRKTSADRNAGSAFWELVRDAIKPAIAATSPEAIASAVKAAMPASDVNIDVDELARKVVLELGKDS